MDMVDADGIVLPGIPLLLQLPQVLIDNGGDLRQRWILVILYAVRWFDSSFRAVDGHIAHV